MFFASINISAAIGQYMADFKKKIFTVAMWILTVFIFCVILAVFVFVFVGLNEWLNSKGYSLLDVFSYGYP